MHELINILGTFLIQTKNLDFWENLLNTIFAAGPAVPILLAMIESFVPALPLVAIVAFNVAAYGSVAGFLYSWAGSCLGCTLVFFFHRLVTKRIAENIRRKNIERKGKNDTREIPDSSEKISSREISDPSEKIGSREISDQSEKIDEQEIPDNAKKNKRQGKIERARKAIDGVGPLPLFIILCLPFTPSSFMNFAFGVADYDPKKYLLVLYAAKLLMIGSLALFGESVNQAIFGKHPYMVILGILLMAGLYLVSRWVRKKHGI